MEKKASDKDTPPVSFMPSGAAALPSAPDFSYPFYNFVGHDMSSAAAFSGASAQAQAQAFAAAQQAQALAAANYYARLQHPQLQAMPFMSNPAATAAQIGALQSQPWMWMAQGGAAPPAAPTKTMPTMAPPFGAVPQMPMMPSPYAMAPFMPPTTAPPPFGMVPTHTSLTPSATSEATTSAAGAAPPPHVRPTAAAESNAPAVLPLPSSLPLPPATAPLTAATSSAIPAVPAMVSIECSMLSLAPNVQLPNGTPFCPAGVPPPAEYATGPTRRPSRDASVEATAACTTTATVPAATTASSASPADGMAVSQGLSSSPATNNGAISAAAVREKEVTGMATSSADFLRHSGASAGLAAGEVAAFSAFGAAPATLVGAQATQQSPPHSVSNLAVGTTSPTADTK